MFSEEVENVPNPLVHGRRILGHEDYSSTGIQQLSNDVIIQQEFDISEGRFVECRVEETADFYKLQSKLVKHFTIASRKNEIVWLRS